MLRGSYSSIIHFKYCELDDDSPAIVLMSGWQSKVVSGTKKGEHRLTLEIDLQSR